MDKLISSITKQFSNMSSSPNQLMANQQVTQQQINDLLNKTSEALMCGPDCQKEKTKEELKQKYLNAQTNLQTAPLQVEESKKNYYVYANGEAYYDTQQEKELTKKAEEICKQLSNVFNTELKNAETLNAYLNNALMNSQHTEDLLNSYREKNIELKQEMEKEHSTILTNDRKTYYENSASDWLLKWNTVYWRLYFLWVIIYVLALFLTPSSLTWVRRILLLIVFIVYPFVINHIVNWFSNSGKSLWDLLPRNVYQNL